MARKVKLGDRGVSSWQQLDTPGDVKRFLRWVILSVRSQTLETKVAGVYSQLAMALLKAFETDDFARDVADIKRRLDQQDAIRTPNGTVPH
jgi:hypothetical protein